jgi:hypothetical protein
MAAETPLVHRSARTGGILIALGAVQFAIVTALTESRYPGYSWTSTHLSALAGPASPWALAFGGSLIGLGLLSVFGLLLSWSAFDSRPARGVGLFFLLAGAVAALLFGIVSTATSFSWGALGKDALYAGTVAVGAGLLVLPFAMHRQERWRASRYYTFASGVVVVASAGLYATGLGFGLGAGGLQMVGLGAALLWAIVEGTHIALLHRFAPGLHVKVAAA